MNTTQPDKNGGGTCPRCGAQLPPGVSADQCPKCLLKAGFGAPLVAPRETVPCPPLMAESQEVLGPGQLFGHYQIVRTLGCGGMGSVFEAEDQETGRRVALKVLRQALDSPDARQRFLREGRLAAAINHPNSVYVFGTEEIGGTPVIAMELVPGGTLQDRVTRQGRLPVAEAVDAVLQIIAGLEAAQAVGVLHRDVKPSNCFVDPDGMVKIGDFGLSISTTVRTEPSLTAAGAFLGTPVFCSPEQLRGDELNARSDMYSVGATLYYLLTGRTPFTGANFVALMAAVLETSAPMAHKVVPGIPRGLSKVIRRCLEKTAGERFRSYEELRRALVPYGSAAPVPATLGLRFIAGTADMMILNLAVQSVLLLAAGSLDPMQFVGWAAQGRPMAFGVMLAGFAASILYFALQEGLWGTTLGKALCRLRVLGPDRNLPGLGRAFVRSLIFLLIPVVPFWIAIGFDIRHYIQGSQTSQVLLSFIPLAIMLGLFATARRHNGFSSVQDLATKTRVVARVAMEVRQEVVAVEPPPASVESSPMVGPYHVIQRLGANADGEWFTGFDLRLLRRVWVRVVPAGTPPVPAAWRNLGRLGRLRWLTGRRSAAENWDAYEALSGEPLARLIRQPQPWAQVRAWLMDLAKETGAASRDGTLPLLAVDRVWITGDGRAKLLDFVAPGLESPAADSASAASTPPRPATAAAVPSFLSELAAHALGGEVENRAAGLTTAAETARPLPLHAREFLKKLPSLFDADAVVAALRPLLYRAAAVTRLRRGMIVVGCAAMPLLMLPGGVFGIRMFREWNRTNPGLVQLNEVLQARWAMNLFHRGGPRPTDRDFEIYIASHHRDLVTNEVAWSGGLALTLIRGENRRFAEQSVADFPAPSASEVTSADAALKPYLPARQEGKNPIEKLSIPTMAGIIAVGTLGFYVCIPALLAALLFRGGLVLRIAGVVFVRRDGRRASRLRVFWRALVSWGAVLIPLGALLVAPGQQVAGWRIVVALLAVVLVGLSLAMPGRGAADRLAGTWPVMR